MQLQYDRASGLVNITADTLAAFAYTKGGSPAAGFHRSIGGADADGVGVRYGVPLAIECEAESLSLAVTAEADAVAFDGTTLTCEMRRRIRRNPEYAAPGEDPVYLARAMLCAYLLAETEGCESIALRIVFVREKDGAAAAWETMLSRAVLRRAFETLLSRAAPFLLIEAERQGAGRDALRTLRFPYKTVREGQEEFMTALYRCAGTSQRLLVSAPTGIGKTISSVYPALRAVGDGRIDRVFYFTAKTVTGNAALEAAKALTAQASALRAIRLTAKERICPRRTDGESERGMCRRCGLCASAAGVSYEERRNRALLALLREERIYDAPLIIRTAAACGICPYELSLDLSEYCEMIVCDYGYLLDSAVRLRRYFEADRGERYAFLFDEAHNLPDRARETYSACLTREELLAFGAEVRAALPDDRPLSDALDRMEAMFAFLSEMCAENASEEDGERGGFCLQQSVPDPVREAVAHLKAVCDAYLRADYENAAPLFEDMRASLRQFGEISAMADSAFAFYTEQRGEAVTVRILCLDPAGLLDAAMQRAKMSVLFSATLSPMAYYADVCGCADAGQLELPSPYERENLCLVTVDSVSTRFSQRKSSADDIAELIETVTEAREGNYIVYFPSYRYMEAVARQYLRRSPSYPVIMQKSDMGIRAREKFLRAFETAEKNGEGVVAFCVLGGIFSEGIDLRGERLIGSIIVGIGLPGLSSELNILADYYDRTKESGREYAYLYPAMNKILQAAGRVIRGEEDRGVVVLIDDRYADPGIRRLFPAHWSHMQYTGDAYTLSVILERFWEE